MIGENHVVLMDTSDISGGTNIKQMPRTLASNPVPAIIHNPAVPPGILNERSMSGLENRSAITAININAYITK